MRRPLVTWLVIFGLVALAFLGTVVTLNSTLYSASGFVQSYLDSLARHDAAGALALPGVTVSDNATLLTREALGSLTDIHPVSDVADGSQRRVTFSYTADGHPGRTTFTVEPADPTLGLFNGWRFAVSPVATIAVTVLHDQHFTVNGFVAVTKATNAAANFAVFIPGHYTFGHESTYLTAKPVAGELTAIEPAEVTVDVQANRSFVQQVQKELNDYLDDTCLPQQVLMPTGCPFGQSIEDRVAGKPVWSMTTYPKVVVAPGQKAGAWAVPPTNALAHLKVDVQSLFDGTVTTFDDDVPFTVEYAITFQPDGSLLITATYG